MREGGLDGLSHLQYLSFLCLNDKESVIVSHVITVHTFRKKGEIKTVSVLTRPACKIPYKTLQPPGPLTQPELAKLLR